MDIKKSFMFLIFLFTIQALAFDPYERGSYEVKHVTYYSLLTSGLDKDLGIYAPDAEGNFPVIYFLSGLGGNHYLDKDYSYFTVK